MAFTNRIRLPFKLTRPQFPETKTVYDKTDGTSKTLSSVIKKSYEGETDLWPEKWHERFAIALGHDNVSIEGDKYLGGVSKTGDYTINWTTFLDYPTAKAGFTVYVTPFNGANSNCQSCEEATQLSLVDDVFGTAVLQNTTRAIDVATNDNICCYPAVFSISSINTDYVASATIDQLGNVSITMKAHTMSGSKIKLLTYRVTCSNGGFDEADVYAPVTGDIAGCQPPGNLVVSAIFADSANFSWTAPSGTPPDHYLYNLYKVSAPGVIVQTGSPSALHVDLVGLDPDTDYIFYVRSQCDGTNDDSTASSFISITVTTNNSSELCGSYSISYDDFDMFPIPSMSATYLDCSGNYQTILLGNHKTKTVCAIQTTPGAPVSITTSRPSNASIIYNGLC